MKKYFLSALTGLFLFSYIQSVVASTPDPGESICGGANNNPMVLVGYFDFHNEADLFNNVDVTVHASMTSTPYGIHNCSGPGAFFLDKNYVVPSGAWLHQVVHDVNNVSSNGIPLCVQYDKTDSSYIPVNGCAFTVTLTWEDPRVQDPNRAKHTKEYVLDWEIPNRYTTTTGFNSSAKPQ